MATHQRGLWHALPAIRWSTAMARMHTAAHIALID
jgi:hypothetical protein